eukprot:UN03499
MSFNCLFLVMVAFVVVVKCSVPSNTEIPTSKTESSNSAFSVDQNVLISIIVTICGLMVIIIAIGAYCCYKKRQVNESKSLDKTDTVGDESENEMFESDIKPRFAVQYMKQQPTQYEMDLHVNSAQNGQNQLIQTQQTFTAFDI